jgi:hypothetical protein
VKNSMLVWQIRLWLLALAAVLLLGNTREPAATRGAQQIGAAQPVGCSVGAVPTRPATAPGALVLGATGGKKCRAASVTAPAGGPSVVAGG